ncbi:antitoxin family protein [Botrimarina sp.]|uniref:antitoxin family protein n=1 Tax=Botrimarina sp. TaxID=2795802 RepID=UPI0032EF4107
MDRVPAIYEDGVFKPLAPVSLPERTEVEIPLPARDAGALPESDEDRIARQEAALRAMFDEIDALPQRRNHDGWSVANNADDVLYGGPNGPA